MGTIPRPLRLDVDSPDCPPKFCQAAAVICVPAVHTIGELDIPSQPLLGLFCSSRCPASVILRAHDLAHALRDSGIAVISGFHSPVERECLRLLLRGTQPLVICAARSLIGIRIRGEMRDALGQGRLLVVSPISDQVRRATAAYAAARNQFVAASADVVLVLHAAPGSKTEVLTHTIIDRCQPLITLGDASNADLIKRGAQPVAAALIAAWWGRYNRSVDHR